uniref:NAC domain-containing protein n=1 Tax=Aegilops tauschii subsp. strangulata TaxID=200361 RepID=A0A453C0V7_AEGTS
MGGSTNLPPGFHFFPSDEELVIHFLRRKAALLPCRPDIVPTLPQNRYDPWELNGIPDSDNSFKAKHFKQGTSGTSLAKQHRVGPHEMGAGIPSVPMRQ